MTVTARPNPAAPENPSADAPADGVTLTIDDLEVSVPKGTLVIRAAEQLGIAIPRFCEHPLLTPVGACRQCLVEVATPAPDGTLRPMPKPQASCTLECTPGMVVRTQRTSPVAAKAQHGMLEFLLINHPLDCPVCDKGGECPLQNQALSNGPAVSRFTDTKRTFPKPIAISTAVLLDRERCVLCQRCTRFSAEIAGDPFIDLQMRGAQQQIGTFSPAVLGFTAGDEHTEGHDAAARSTIGAALLGESGQPFASYFSGNTVQICPVGALTGAAYRFRARPFDLVSTPTVCEHCASGCALRTDHRANTVTRRLAGNDPEVNEEWTCDKGRWAFPWRTLDDRITQPLVRDPGTRELRPTSWPEALQAAARGLAAARDAGGVGVLPGGRVTLEDAYAYAKFARMVLRTNDVDARARAHSAEEAAFLGHAVAGTGLSVGYADLEAAPTVLLAGFEPEEESPIVFLRLRKAARRGQRVYAVASWAGRGLDKLGGRLLPAAPGTEAEVLEALVGGMPPGTDDAEDGTSAEDATVARDGAVAAIAEVTDALRAEGSVLVVGERLAAVPGALSAARRLARATGARLAWIPRRAGERGAVEAGALPTLLPGGHPVAVAGAREQVARSWGLDDVPADAGRDTAAILAAAADGGLGALLVGGVEVADLPDPEAARTALDRVGFLVSIEARTSEVTERADVVLPVAVVPEKPGTFVDWEGRRRPFPAALVSNGMPDFRVLDALADQFDVALGLRGLAQVHAELDALGTWDGRREAPPDNVPVEPPRPRSGQAVLSTWRLLLDAGRLQDGEPHLAGTAHRAVARLSAATAEEIGAVDGEEVVVSTERGAITLPLAVTVMPDRVVWLPANSARCAVGATLGAGYGSVVTISRGENR
ncbi:MAG: NADH-quinone oxidoreductase subunit G [Actinomycetales bacterium]|nr:NADH-quinone oxidoreductase subunit G [Actinomycetales bacterium]